MPKIEVDYMDFSRHLGRQASMAELEQIFPTAKAELDEALNADGIMKVELNDTNRPDLWSPVGLARCLRIHGGGKDPVYPWAEAGVEPVAKVLVKPGLEQVRPFIAAFVAQGRKVDDATLKSLIQSQEKLCWNFGQKRKSIAMGIYRADLIQFPVSYQGADPDRTRMTPLGLDQELSLRQVLAQHPKGQEYGHILADKPLFPLLRDAKDRILSFPPVINSHDLGAVQVGDSSLFVELTGTDLASLMLACNIMACDMADMGFEIKRVEIEYPQAGEMGKTVTCPLRFQQSITVESAVVNKTLGQNLGIEEIVQALVRMGNQVEVSGQMLMVQPALYRNDFLHGVDVVEDVMIGRGMESFEPCLPAAFTIGRLTAIEEFSRRVKSLMVGLGYQEMIFNYLGSARDYVWRMHPEMAAIQAGTKGEPGTGQGFDSSGLVQIINPMSENYEFVRNSILPCLLGAESISGNAPYPHLVFETGKVARRDPRENYGSRTDTDLGFLVASNSSDFNGLNSQIQALMYFLSREYTLAESQDPRFLPGRRADILCADRKVGCFGEIHPGVLENWGITVPCAGGEITLELLL